MPKWFGYSAYLSYKYSIYANYTPTGVLGNNERFDGTNDSYDRRAAIYEVPEDGEIHSISIFHEGGSGDMLLAVYSDDNNEPDQRLAVTASTPINSNAGWQTVELTGTVDVNEGDKIWLAWLFEDNPGVHCQQGTPGQVATVNSSQGWSYGMPADFGSCTTSDWVYSICVGYTPDQQDQQPELLGNPYMFTGRRFDLETGLYYYRARYYNPYIGRFLQTDPVGYSDSMNWYNYCGSNPLNCVDPIGRKHYKFKFLGYAHEKAIDGKLTFAIQEDDGRIVDVIGFDDIDAWCKWAPGYFASLDDWVKENQVGYELSRHFSSGPFDPDYYDQDWFFWRLQAMLFLGTGISNIRTIEEGIADGNNVNVVLNNIWMGKFTYNYYKTGKNGINLYWHPTWDGRNEEHNSSYPKFHPLVGLAHELSHGADYAYDGKMRKSKKEREKWAIICENQARGQIKTKVPGWEDMQFRYNPYFPGSPGWNHDY